MSLGICAVPVSPLRAEASHRSEMVSQIQFGEFCQLGEQDQTDWVRVTCCYDGYRGWCQRSHMQMAEPSWMQQQPGVLTRRWVSLAYFNGQPIRLPLGSSVAGVKRGRWYGTDNQVRLPGALWYPAAADRDARSIRQLALMFLNTPYLWGGKTVFGTDCSGLTQTLFRFFNLPLLRDAHQQATQGEMVESILDSRSGDLAFFGPEAKPITHVGLLLNKREIIHASGRVRVDSIDQQGIVDRTSGEHTHPLRMIRRYF